MSNENNKSKIENQKSKILLLFTRTPLHVGAGASVGAIDQPIIRERHTGFPVIPATSLKGTFADEWNERTKVMRKRGDGEEEQVEVIQRSAEGKWLFGETDANNAAAGALIFTEARLLAFPVRSAKGSFAWITCPLILRRAARDGVITQLPSLRTLSDDQAIYKTKGPIDLDGKVVLEEYTFTNAGTIPEGLGEAFAKFLDNGNGPADPVWEEVASRLVILSDGMMSFFAQNACEVTQRVRIDDETGTVATGALFNQENVPSETLFYSVVFGTQGRVQGYREKSARDALEAFKTRIQKRQVFQFGGDASTGLGWCTAVLKDAELKK
ncbi:MAG: type III-B CRISPR module RAMP protein Cmr4 [Verrucomicrobiae bacterium]|nr:type III-B CRISPR module RAMP protein Cmr4 [Verrucomicrobiae bacterium]